MLSEGQGDIFHPSDFELFDLILVLNNEYLLFFQFSLHPNRGPYIKYVTLEGEGVREGVTVCDRGGGVKSM